MLSDNDSPSDGEEQTEETNPEPALTVWLTDNGFHFSINEDLNPVHLAGIAWYLEKMASRALAIVTTAQQQLQQPELFVPEGFTKDHKRKRN